jgi:mannose-1-phosphate guanylyltransferase/mannose-6-phosphate isomerase
MNYAIILAGGIGSRFWPLSTELEPKQFLEFCSKTPMLTQTLERARRCIPNKNIYLAANKLHRVKITRCLKALSVSANNIFFEPTAKNTFAPIAFLSARIYSRDKEAVIVVLPCDHFIKDKEKFSRLIKKGLEVARQDYIVTLGVRPTRPETGYGYIWAAGKINKSAGGLRVQAFIEKPNIQKARQFLRQKRYFWNSGIFIFKAAVLLQEIEKFMPAAFRRIMKLTKAPAAAITKYWHGLPSLSIDYAIMEKTRKMVLLPADFGWVDVGSWQAVEEVIGQDRKNNIFKGSCIDLESRNLLVWGHDRLVATVGLDNLVIVDTPDALLVCAKNRTQDVKRLVQKLQYRKRRRKDTKRRY